MGMKTHGRTLASIVAAALIVAACGGSSASKNASSTLATATQGAQSTPASDGWRAPEQLPVTPVALSFKPVDPKLDALPGARTIVGENEGATYNIEVPDAWNGEVVYFAHGFRGNSADLVVQAPPIRDYLIQHGYAWAASSFSKNGYEPGVGARDTYALRDVFAQKVGTPKRSYIYGQSMGGHVVAFSLEQYPTAYDGALSECGVVAGHEILDYLLSWAALASYFGGTDLLASTTDASTLIGVLRNDLPKVLGSAARPTDKGRAFADAIEQLTGGPRPFFVEGFKVNYVLNFGLLLQAVAQPQVINAVAENQHTTYALDPGFGVTSDELNRGVTRVAANPAYRDPATYPEFANFTGKIKRPLLTIHGTGDLFVPISLEQSYRRIVDAAGAGDLLVQRAIRRAGHCTFSQDERIAAFEDLVKWVEQGQKPAGDNILSDLRDAGRAFTTPPLPDDPGGVTP
jgi:pimeloyl-ACP methyl ester carboxylesterase